MPNSLPIQPALCKPGLTGSLDPVTFRIHFGFTPNIYYMAGTFRIPSYLQSHLPISGGFPKVAHQLLKYQYRKQGNHHGHCGKFPAVERPHEPPATKASLESFSDYVSISPWVLTLMDVLQEHVGNLNATNVDLKVPPCHYIRYGNAPKGYIPPNLFLLVTTS